MSRFKLIFSVFLIFGIFTNVHASELKRLCGIKAPSVIPSPVCDEESGIVFYGGPNCDNQVFVSIYFANLIGFNNQPTQGVNYSLPTTMPDLYLQLDIDFDGIFEVTIPILNDQFIYDGVKVESDSNPGMFHYVFEHEINISQYFLDFNPCPDDDEKTITMRLVHEGKNPGTYFLFDPLPYGAYDDICSHEVFHETCSLSSNPINCNSSSSLTNYDVDICIDCTTDCAPRENYGIEIDNQFAETKFVPVISPNPFLDEITVAFQTQKENTPTQIEIYDWTGAMVLTKALPSEIGNRKVTIDMATLPKGVYYLNLITDETSTTSKIIKL